MENRGNVPRDVGQQRLWGYNLKMAFPDRRIWLYQMLDIFVRDCYGVRKLPARPRVIDGGANIGALSLFVLWHRPEAYLQAVEPDPNNLRYLRDNLSQRPDKNASILPAALGTARGQTRLQTGSSDSLRAHATEGQFVDMIPLADLLQEPADLVKLDIEGSELAVLEAAAEHLSNARRLVIEYHDYRDQPNRLPALLQLLQDARFDRIRVDDHREFNREDSPSAPTHCCLVEAWRSPTTL